MFSLVMLTWNNYEKFKRCMTSMFNALLDDRVEELIILDNGSHDVELLDYLKKISKINSKIKVIFGNTNLGVAGGREVLFSEASGEHIFSFDSDVTLINPDMLFNIYLEFIKNEDHYLLGGGGGNHPFFPALDLRDVNNLPPPDKPGEIRYVDEVAGWFQAFPSKILKCNGGKVYMDTQFHPFWGEDTDFCFQIKMLNKKCGIVAKNIIAHAWSSCNKEEMRKDIYPQWNKFLAKWQPTFGDLFKFNFDENFYDTIYNIEGLIEKDRLKDHYFNYGMFNGSVCSKKQISLLYPEANFVGKNKISYENKESYVGHFVDEYLSIEKIYERYFNVIENKLSSSNGIIVLTFDEIKAKNREDIYRKILSNFKKNSSIAFVTHDVRLHKNIIDYIKLNFSSYAIFTFYNYNSSDINYLMFIEFCKRKRYNWKSVFKVNEYINLQSKLFDYDLENIHNNILPVEGLLEEEVMDKNDYFCYALIKKLVTPLPDYKFSKNGCFINKFTTNFDHVILENSLKIPFDYNILVNPRSSPKHTLRKYICYNYYKIKEKEERKERKKHEIIKKKNKLLVYLCSINEEDDLKDIKNNVEYFKEDCDVLVINCGSIKIIKVSYISADYYAPINDTKPNIGLYLNLPNIIKHYKEYENVIFLNSSKSILGDVSDFIELSGNINLTISKKFIEYSGASNGKYDLELFSIVSTHIDGFLMFLNDMNKKKNELGDKLNVEESIMGNLKMIFKMEHLWNILEKKENESEKNEEDDEDEEKIVYYYKEREKYLSEESYPFDDE